MPNIPRLLIVKEPPWYSSGFSLPVRAREAKSRIEELISEMEMLRGGRINWGEVGQELKDRTLTRLHSSQWA